MGHESDKELEEYRSIMETPSTFEEGFSWRTVVGAVFLGFVMMPASMYMGLVVGEASIGDAARWVTVILFLEIAKRSRQALRQQELFVLYYMAGMALASPFQGLLFRQYLVRSPAAEDLQLVGVFADPDMWWVSPTKEYIEQHGRSFLSWGWFGPIALIVLGQLLGRIDHFGLGYFLYRLTSDVEKLPFPLAPVGAAGSIALAESTQDKQTWRWRTFSIGTMLGLMYGTIYTAVPAVTGAIFGKAVQIIPIPWIELTDKTSDVLPAVAVGLTVHLGLLIVGFVIPFWSVVGGMVAVISTFILNPALYKLGILKTWNASMRTPETGVANQVDFYMSWNIGVMLSIAIIGFIAIAKGLTKSRESGGLDLSKLWVKNEKRGDISIWTSLLIYVFSTASYIFICLWLVPGFPVLFFVFYGFVYTPVVSYATARLEGMAGQALNIPFIREAGFILASRWGDYKGIGIWFAPIPIHNYGYQTVGFRQVELTGTSLRSIIKTEFMVVPIILAASILFSEFIWSLAAIPSEAYPYANLMWDMGARTQLLLYSSTTGQESPFFDALKPLVILAAFVFGLGLFGFLSAMSLPLLFIYGVVRGFGHANPHGLIFEFIGALIGRFYFEKRFGREKWRQYAPVLCAGYFCGEGLISAASIAISMISKSVSQMLY
ncbi:MAG: peptide transporter [Planctomycetes bacterium]|nr:peptide transporter [Planctomycetota bacterium]